MGMPGIKCHLFSLGVLAAICILLSGCSQPPPSIPPVEKLFPAEIAAQPKLVSNQNVEFNLDGTPSMQGFARATDGKFAQLLQDLDLSIAQTWQRSHIRYHRFGSIVEDVHQEPFYVVASQPNFFQSTKAYSTTRIDTVFQKSTAGNLTIVMTDLFEQNLDIGSIQEALRAASFPASASLAIWQWEIPFAGPIYDFDFRTSQGHSYSGPRALYMMALGPDRSIEALRHSIERTVTIGRPNFLLLSKNLAIDPRNWLSVTQTSNAALRSRSSGDGQAMPYLVYRHSHGCAVTGFSASSRLSSVENSVITQFGSHPGAFDASLFAVTGRNGSWTATPRAQPKVNAANTAHSGSNTSLKVELDCSVLDGADLMLLRIQRIGTPEDVVLPDWVSKSSANTTEFNAAFQRKQPDWGNKTLNLAPLIRGLANTAVDGTAAASAYFYFVKS